MWMAFLYFVVIAAPYLVMSGSRLNIHAHFYINAIIEFYIILLPNFAGRNIFILWRPAVLPIYCLTSCMKCIENITLFF